MEKFSMTTRPTLEETERAILNIFKEHGTRANECIKSIVLSPLISGEGRFIADEINDALSSMHNKEWIDASYIERQQSIKLLIDGFAQVADGDGVTVLNPPVSIDDLFNYADDEEEVDFNLEGSYRRGYHQAIAHVADLMRCGKISADTLDEWVIDAGMKWRKDTRLDRCIRPPVIVD
jgi:hypothetical protein